MLREAHRAASQVICASVKRGGELRTLGWVVGVDSAEQHAERSGACAPGGARAALAAFGTRFSVPVCLLRRIFGHERRQRWPAGSGGARVSTLPRGERIARGELHLCALCALAPLLNDTNAAELFEACTGKTRRQIEQLLAARFPRPDVRERIRRLPAPRHVQVEAVSQPLQTPRVLDALGDAPSVEASSVRPADPEIAGAATNSTPPSVPARALDGRPRPRGRELEPLSAERFGVHFTADAELHELIERARALASHRISNGDLAGLMKLVLASFVKQEENRRFGIGKLPRRARSEAKPASRAEPTTPPGGASAPPRTSKRQRARCVRDISNGAPATFAHRLGAKTMLETAVSAHSSRAMAGAATRRRCSNLTT